MSKGGALLCLCVTLVCIIEIQCASKFIDLSYAFNNETVVWPNRKPSFKVDFEGYTGDGIWVASKGFCSSEHISTHIDAPYHFNKNGRMLNEIPLEDLIDIPGVMIDIYEKVHKMDKDGKLTVLENYALTRDDIIEWESRNGAIPPKSLVLVRTGYDKLWPNSAKFRGEKGNVSADTADPGTLDTILNFPGFDASAAKYLTTEKQVLGVGIDALSIDPGNQSRIYPAHQIFASRNVYMLENVANLHLLPPKGFQLWAVPFKIDRGTGAPTRVLARLNEDTKNEL